MTTRTGRRRFARWKRFASASLPALLIGCTTVPMVPGSARAQDEGAAGDAGPALGTAPRGSTEDAQLMFEIMIGELAGRRGRLDVALEGYLAASRRTDDVRVADRAARLAIFARAWAEAEQALERWMSLEPASGEARELYAQVLLRLQRAEASAEQFARLIEASDDPGEAIDRTFGLLQADPDEQLAARVVELLATRFADVPEAQLGVARLALAAGDVERARGAIDGALERDPGNTAALLLRARILASEDDDAAAIAVLEGAIRESPEDPRLRLGLAQLLVEGGRSNEARGALAAIAARIGPDGTDAGDTWLTIGLLALEADFPEDAEGYFRSLLDTGEHTDQANYQLARILDRRGDLEEAVKRYDAVAYGELYVPAQIRIAEIRGAGGDIAAARARLEQLRANLPDPALAPRLVTAEGRILQSVGDDRAALEVLSAGLERYPDDGELLYARALAAGGAGQPAMLEEDLRRLIESEPGNAHALNALGYHFVERDERLDEASELLEEADRLRPDDPAIMDSLGWLRFRQGRVDEAIVLLEKAFAMFPDPEIAAHLGEALAAAGRDEEAREIVDEALEGAPDYDPLKRVRQSLQP